MGWDNASTIATEVEIRSGPIRARCWSGRIVALSYILPFAAMWMTGIHATAWETGSWADIAGLLGGPLLRVALVLGGMISAFGMFNALVMSYSRLPLAMAQDGMFPKVFGKLQPKSRAPWVAILALAIGWAMCLGLGFERLVTSTFCSTAPACSWNSWRWPSSLPRAGFAATVPRPRRIVRRHRHRHSAGALARFLCNPQRA